MAHRCWTLPMSFLTCALPSLPPSRHLSRSCHRGPTGREQSVSSLPPCPGDPGGRHPALLPSPWGRSSWLNCCCPQSAAWPSSPRSARCQKAVPHGGHGCPHHFLLAVSLGRISPGSTQSTFPGTEVGVAFSPLPCVGLWRKGRGKKSPGGGLGIPPRLPGPQSSWAWARKAPPGLVRE